MAARAPLCSLLFRYSQQLKVGTWSQDEGVLDTRVLATHEAQSGQPAGTFGAHRGARFKTSVPQQVSSFPVAVSDLIPSRFYQEPLFVVKLVQFHQLPSVEFAF